jgi:hypothetical protein
VSIPFWDEGFAHADGKVHPDNPWDTVLFNGEHLPGKCSVKAEPKIQIDRKKANGVDGAQITLQGYLPGKVQVEIEMWTAEQWELYQEMLPTFWRKPTKNDESVKAISKARGMTLDQAVLYQAAVTISHPACTLHGIKAIVVEQITTPEPGSVTGLKVVRLLCSEYLAPAKKAAPSRLSAKPQNAKLAKELQPKNGGGPRPSTTDAGPGGAKKTTTPGAS